MPLMASLSRAFSYVITAQVQSLGLILMAYWVGDWLNKNHPISFSWCIVTFIVALLGVAQTFYVVIKAAMSQGTPSAVTKPDTKPPQ